MWFLTRRAASTLELDADPHAAIRLVLGRPGVLPDADFEVPRLESLGGDAVVVERDGQLRSLPCPATGSGGADAWLPLGLAEKGHPVDLFSLFQVKRSHTACAQGGMNASETWASAASR